jgi:hypothetical protein
MHRRAISTRPSHRAHPADSAVTASRAGSSAQRRSISHHIYRRSSGVSGVRRAQSTLPNARKGRKFTHQIPHLRLHRRFRHSAR